MTTSFSLEFIGSKLIDVNFQVVMKDIASNKNYIYISGEGADGNGYELWRTDGTENGTTLVKDINNGSGSSSPSYLTVMEDIANNKNYLYFSADNGTDGKELWRTDGTTTTLVRDIMTGTGNSSNPLASTPSYIIFSHFTVMKDIDNNKNYLYFSATDGTHGHELWRSDGTENGTTLVKDIRTGGDSSSPSYLTVMEDIANNKNYLYFRADNGTDGRELWRSDGTESGTTLVKDINTGSGSASSPSKFTVMKDIASNKNYLYFIADDGTHGHELWRSDGTENGTTLVKDIMTGSEESDLYEVVVMKDTETNTNYLYFAASSVENVYNVWRSDGTTEGTIFTATTSLHQGDTEPSYFNVMKDSTTNKNYLYFVDSGDSEGNIWSLYRLLITNSSTVSVEPVKPVIGMFNNMTYYKPGSLGAGHGTVVNSRSKTRRT
jgi:ELWxxDGT repeat protein